MEDLSYF